MKELYLDFEKFKEGLYALDHTTKAPLGTAAEMTNLQIDSTGGISPRPGLRGVGEYVNTSSPVRGLVAFKTPFDDEPLIISVAEGKMRAYSEARTRSFTIATDLSDAEWGFLKTLDGETNDIVLVASSPYDDYRIWTGAYTALTAPATGGTTLSVETTLRNDTYWEGESNNDSHTNTRVFFDGHALGTDQFKGFYLAFETGEVREITGNGADYFDIEALDNPPAPEVAITVRQLRFPASGTLLIDEVEYEYSGIDRVDEIVVSAPVTADEGEAVVSAPTLYPDAPKGNRFTNLLGRTLVGNVRSGYDAGEEVGVAAPNSVFVSKINKPGDYSFNAVRDPGDGDIIRVAYGDSEVVDVKSQEKFAYVFKRDYIEAFQYSTGENDADIALREPLKQEIGSVGKVIKGADDVYFITPDSQFSSIGRVATRDTQPLTTNLGLRIKQILERMRFDKVAGIEHEARIYFSARASGEDAENSTTVVYDKETKAFQGLWDIGANHFASQGDRLLLGDSRSANVLELDPELRYDALGAGRFPIRTSYRSHFFNVTPSVARDQRIFSMLIEGEITPATEVSFSLFKDMDATNPFVRFTFSGTETQFIDQVPAPNFLGASPLALNAQGVVSPHPTETGVYTFFIRVFFPFEYAKFLAYGFDSEVNGGTYRIHRIGLGMTEDIRTPRRDVKNIV